MDFTDTTVALGFNLTDWNSDWVTVQFTDSTPGAFTGLTLVDNTFPSPPSGTPVFTATGDTITFNFGVPGTLYPATGFSADFGPGGADSPEPSTLPLLTSGVIALAVIGVRKRLPRAT